VRDLLDRNRASYEWFDPTAADPQAQTGRVPARELARVTVVRHAGALSLAVLPVHAWVDLDRLGAALRDEVVLVPEPELAAAFPDCDAAAVPPFGALYGIKTYVDASLTQERRLAFHAGTRADVIRMSFEDYRRVAAPVVLWFAESPARTES
jgi:Ala-tRNA(Pro) deacylase